MWSTLAQDYVHDPNMWGLGDYASPWAQTRALAAQFFPSPDSPAALNSLSGSSSPPLARGCSAAANAASQGGQLQQPQPSQLTTRFSARIYSPAVVSRVLAAALPARPLPRRARDSRAIPIRPKTLPYVCLSSRDRDARDVEKNRSLSLSL